MQVPEAPGDTAAFRPRSLARRCVGIVLVAALTLTLGGPAAAEPDEAANPQEKLDQLEKRADNLADDYRGELVTLEDAKRAAERAAARAGSVHRDLDRARRQVARLAAEKYMSSGSGPTLTVLASGSPQTVLDRAATVRYLARQNVREIATMRRLAAEVKAAKEKARTRVEEVQHQLEKLEDNRAEVERLIDRYEEQAAARAARAAWSPPSGNITSRMSNVRAEIVSRFGKGYGVGCYRPDDSGEHPLGRACDFMLSSAGAVPSSSQVERGYDIAEWAVSNAERLGIMYVIYRQRIWDIRCGCGWEPMEDRGGATANHVDHVHISVF